MKDSTTYTLSKKNLGQSLRKSAIILGSRVSSCISKKSDTEKRSSRPSVRLIDANGVDLTPLPLLNDEKRPKEERDVSTEASQASIHSGSSLHITNPFAFTRSVLSVSSPLCDSHSEASDENVDRYKGYTEVKTLAQPQREVLTEEDLNELVDVIVAETDTMFCFDKPPCIISVEAEDATLQQKRNSVYKSLVASRLGNDRYMERGMNTFNASAISKVIQTDRIVSLDKSSMATIWDMKDSLDAKEGTDETNLETEERQLKTKVTAQTTSASTDGGKSKNSGFPVETKVNDPTGLYTTSNMAGSLMKHTSGGPVGSSSSTPHTMTSNSESDLFGFRYTVASVPNFAVNNSDILSLPKVKDDLIKLERALNINTYFDKLRRYEDLHLRTTMLPFSLERSDTDPSSAVGLGSPTRIPGITAVPTAGTLEEPSMGGHPASSVNVNLPVPLAQVTVTSNGHSVGSAALHSGATTVRSVEFRKDAPKNPDLELLWRYQSPMTKGRNISDMAWNKENTNILAVGYGQFEFDNQRPGLVCCWTHKCIEHPERFYETPSGVTAIGWSNIHSNLLAVGMFSGVILVFDVRKTDQTPILDTTYAIGRHLGPIRKIQWVVRDSGRAEMLSEVLVSVSMDGRVTEWFVRKGFDSTGDCDYHCDLMVLKRPYISTPGAVTKQKRHESLISRTAFGTSMAFNPRESNIYVVGTEDGLIHKCSCSYNEQYLETYPGHTASVYQIEWSPFAPDVFLSCSADWTIKIWHLDNQKPIINIQTNVITVSSIAWSFQNPLLFASANEGALEIWNLDNSTIDPFVIETVSGDANMTSVIFATNSECVLVGDDQGTVHVYSLIDFPEPPEALSEQVTRLNKVFESCMSDDPVH